MIYLLCFGLVVSATVLFAYFWYETIKSKLTFHGTNLNPDENSRTPLKLGEPEFPNLSVLYLENCELKNQILLAATDLAKVIKERHEMASERDKLLTEVRRWQETYDLYTLEMKNKLEEYDAKREEYKLGKKELVSTVLAREKIEARFKSKIQDLQAALTSEHIRGAASLNQELLVRSELQVSKSRVAELELLNTRQKKRIAQLESQIAFENQRLSKTCKNKEAGIIDLTRGYGRIIGHKGKKARRSVRSLWSYNLLTSTPHGHNEEFNQNGNFNSHRAAAKKHSVNLPAHWKIELMT